MSYTLNESMEALTSLSQRFQTATPENPITGQEVSDFGNHLKNVLNLLAVSDIQTSQVTTLLEVAKTSNLQKDLEQSLDIDALKNLTTLLEVAKSANLQKDLEQSLDIDALKNLTTLLEVAKTYNLQKDSEQDLRDAQHDASLADNAITDASQSSNIAALKVIRKDAANVFYVDRQFANQTEMIAQDAAALQGVSNRPFATPYSAKKAAIAYLQANPSKEAVIEIARGNVFTSADYVASEHDVTVSMGGVDYISGMELAFHGITYVMYGVTIETPLMDAAFLAAQSDNGLSVKKAVFYGGALTNMNSSHSQDNIWFCDLERVSHTNVAVRYNVGVKYFEVKELARCLFVGSRNYAAGTTGNRALTYELLQYKIGKVFNEDSLRHDRILYLDNIHNKRVIVDIEEAELRRFMLWFGQGTGVSADGTFSGAENAQIKVVLKSLAPTGYAYVGDTHAGLIAHLNAKQSNFDISIPAFTTTVPKVFQVSGIQEGNSYYYKGAKVKIDNPTSVEMPFNLALDTSVLVLENWNIDSNVNNILFILTSGKLILRNCKIRQTANQPIFNISAGATVVLENTHLNGTVSVASGLGKIISKKSTANVPVGTAVLRGDLAISKFYDESLNQTELSFANNMATFEHGTQWFEIPNPNQLRIAVSETVSVPFGETVSIQHSGRTLEINNTKTVVDENGATHNVVSLFMQQATAPNESKVTVPYELVPTDYILGV